MIRTIKNLHGCSELADRLRFLSISKIKLIKKGGKVSLASGLFGASSFFELARGLMFRRLPKDSALVFFLPDKRHISLHMFFVFHKIDVLFGEMFTDPDGRDCCFRILDMKSDFRPFTLTFSDSLVDSFIELPAGSIKKYSLGKDDVILFKG